MFRKLVASLPYSPALVGQLGFYARRLRKEEATRRLGLIFTAMALVMQSFAVLSPPESANASNPSDMISGGVKSVSELLAVYDQSARGNGDFKDILDYAGVTRSELSGVKEMTVNSKQFGTGESSVLSWGREHRFSESQGEVKHNVIRSNSKVSTVYSKPIWLYDSKAYTKANGSNYRAYVGHSAKLGWFAIHKDCGNLLSRTTPKPHPAGKLLSANCDKITGYAYDARQAKSKVQVYLYFDGPPGKGEKKGPVTASENSPNSPIGNGHGFTADVPDKYKRLGRAVPVWGVLVPLPGWNPSTVQFTNATQIPPNCFTPPSPEVAECTYLKTHIIERTKFSLTAKSKAENGAKIQSYKFVVKDNNDNIVVEKSIDSNFNEVNSGLIDLGQPGDYKANVVVKTSVGDKSGSSCNTVLSVASPENCPYNPGLAKDHPECLPCPTNSQIWINDADCTPTIVLSKEAKNLTGGGINAHNTTVKSGDRIEYTIYAENVGSVPANLNVDEQLTDILEYASVIQAGGGVFKDNGKVLSWESISLQPGQKAVRSFAVQINSSIPATPQGTSEPGSYDCVMTNAFGNTITLNVDCPAAKMVESAVKELPSTGTGANIIFGVVLAALTTYFYLRNRQLNKEIRLIRHEFNAGTI